MERYDQKVIWYVVMYYSKAYHRQNCALIRMIFVNKEKKKQDLTVYFLVHILY